MPEPFYRRDYGLGTVEEARKKKSQPTFENILQDKSSFMRNTDANKTRGLLSSFETASKAKEEARKKEVQPQKNPWELPIPGGGIKKPTGRDGSFPSYDKGKDKGDGGGTTTPSGGGETRTCESIGKIGTWGDCKDDPGSGNGKCQSDADCGDKVCVDGECVAKKDDGTCPGCDTTTHDCIDGNCTPKKTGSEDNGDGTPSLTTILKPDETPDLMALTEDMDLRNMITNVLNKNNPLFKQARTRAFQAMAARGIVNSSMAEEAVMSAMLAVAKPIAERVIGDLQRIMEQNVNKSNDFKTALNNMYYQELLKRVDAANNWNLERMSAQQVNWQTILGAKVEGMGIKDDPAYERYMSMLSKLGPQPSWNVAA